MNPLNKTVIVANKLWRPIKIISTVRAFTLLIANKASVIDKDYNIYDWEKWCNVPCTNNDTIVRTAHLSIKVPDVVVLLKYDKIPKKGMKLTKRNIFLRDGFKCQYTGKEVTPKTADLDHITPRSKGGKTSWDNLVVCSKDINRLKADRTPEEAGLTLLKKPTKPKPKVIYVDPKVGLSDFQKAFLNMKN